MGLFSDNFPVLDSRRLYLPTFAELAAIVKDFTVVEIVTLVGVGLWLVLLAMPLSGIDRRDPMTRITYLFFMCFGGVALMIAVPGKFPTVHDAGWQLSSMGAMAALASIRWARRPSRPTVKQTVVKKPKELRKP